MNVSVQNVCGARTKAGAIRREMESGNTDILVLIETHLKTKHISLFNKHIGFDKHQDKVIHDVSAGNDYKGVSVVVGKNVPFTINEILKSNQGQHIIIKGKHKIKPVVLTCIYGNPTTSDTQSLQVLRRAIYASQKLIDSEIDPIILFLGDFNFVTANYDHSNNDYQRKPNTEIFFNNFLRRNSLVDMHLTLSNGLPTHTFIRPNNNQWVSSRLDRIYLSEQHMIKPKLRTDKLTH